MTNQTANVKLYFSGSTLFSKNEIHTLLKGHLTDDDTAKLILEVSNEKTQLAYFNPAICGPVFVDFSSKNIRWRQGQGELIHRATGLSKHKQLSIIDATAGLGVDAFILAGAGAKVTLIERNPVVYLLLHDGLHRASQDPAANKQVSQIKLIHSRAETYLTQHKTDVIYLDPMYPQTAKSAKSNKRMQLLQILETTSTDSSNLLQTAIQNARYRVVVKRPVKGEYLEGHKPSFSLKGRSTRFDIYANKAF